MTGPLSADEHHRDSHRTLWSGGAAAYPPLRQDQVADVVVVGAGIAGLTTAVLLVRQGLTVVVLEGRNVGGGTSGHTTAKVSALQGARYRSIEHDHGRVAAASYAEAQTAGLRWMETQVQEQGIKCDWERRPAISYATTTAGQRIIDQEVTAATAAGLAVAEHDELDLPFPVSAAVILDDQAQFNPAPYLQALAAEVDNAPTGAIYEHSRVSAVHGLRQHEVVTEHATVRAEHVVVATLLPILDRGLFFARSKPKSSYIVALRATGPLPKGMYLSVDEPTRSLRTARDGKAGVLLVGGSGHATGHDHPSEHRYQELIDFGRRHFPVTDVVAQWSAHDYETADHLPWVGSCSPLSPNIMVATGFEKWGMTMGTAAALALSDRINGDAQGVSANWGGLFSPTRLARRGFVRAARMNAEVALALTAGWTHPDRSAGPDGTGARHRQGLLPVGEPGPAAPTVDEVVLVCPHLGGVCAWNSAERTWDCPLHGSRFEAAGEVLSGPATRPLRSSPSDPSRP